MDSFIALINTQVVPYMSRLWVSVDFWRNLSIILLIFILFSYLFRDGLKKMLMKEQVIKHDKEIFQLLDLIMPEQKIMSVLDKLEKEKSFEISSLSYIDKFRDSLKGTTRQYINPKIKKSCAAFLESLNELRTFLDQNFIEFPSPGQERSALMHPNPEIDGGGNEKEIDEEKFELFSKNLTINTSMTRKDYQKYRETVKIMLLV